ncbi:hypothetical protein D3C84_239240 [compost metagenome]
MNIPMIPVAMAGIALRIPSGSQVLVTSHICPFNTTLSIQAAKLVPFSKFEIPIPGTGISVIIPQYPNNKAKAANNCVFWVVFKYNREIMK